MIWWMNEIRNHSIKWSYCWVGKSLWQNGPHSWQTNTTWTTIASSHKNAHTNISISHSECAPDQFVISPSVNMSGNTRVAECIYGGICVFVVRMCFMVCGMWQSCWLYILLLLCLSPESLINSHIYAVASSSFPVKTMHSVCVGAGEIRKISILCDIFLALRCAPQSFNVRIVKPWKIALFYCRVFVCVCVGGTYSRLAQFASFFLFCCLCVRVLCIVRNA